MSNFPKIPLVLGGENATDVVNDAVGAGNIMGDTQQWYFKVPPPETIKIRSSVVIRVPLYNNAGTAPLANEVYASKKPGSLITFEEFYRNYDAEDFAQYLVGSGIIAKSIRHALLYNYFGFPVANIHAAQPGAEEFLFSEIESTRFGDGAYGNSVSRVIRYDPYFTETLNTPPGDDSTFFGQPGKKYKDFLKSGAGFVDTLMGVYQFGHLGEIPPFIAPADGVYGPEPPTPQPGDPPEAFEETSMHIGYYHSKFYQETDGTTLYTGNEEGYEPYKDFFGVFHGAKIYGLTDTDIGTSISFVEPIGIAPKNTGFIAYQPKSEEQEVSLSNYEIPRTEIRTFDFDPTFGADGNSLSKTYIRAWHPAATNDYGPNQPEDYGTGEGFYTVLDGIHPVYKFNPGFPNPLTNFLWDPGDSIANYSNSIIRANINQFNYLEVTVGIPSYSNWQAKIGYEFIKENEVPGTSFEKNNFWKFSNIASMYKLVPGGLTPSETFPYLIDPSKTLNKAFPRIFKYVKDITPLEMIQHTVNSDRMKDNYPEYVENGSELNNSDIITPNSAKTINQKTYLRKFRIGHELQEQKIEYQDSGGARNSPLPSSEYNTLGFTHTIGTFDPHKGSAWSDILKEGEDPTNPWHQYYRNKISFVFKSFWHQLYFLDPKGSIAAKGAYSQITNLSDGYVGTMNGQPTDFTNVQPLFKALDSGTYFVPPIFNEEVNNLVQNGYITANELQKDYYISSKLLCYMYLMKPSGLDNNDVPDYDTSNTIDPFAGTKAMAHITEFDVNSLDSGMFLPSAGQYVLTPTIMNFMKGSEFLADQVKGLKFIDDHWNNFFSGKSDVYEEVFPPGATPSILEGISPYKPLLTEDGFLTQHFIDLLIEHNTDPESVAETAAAASGDVNATGLGIALGFGGGAFPPNADIKVVASSPFALPIWKYDAGTEQDIKDINWPSLASSTAKSSVLSSLLQENPSVQTFKNYGIPKWVRGLRIFPSLDRDTKVTDSFANPIAHSNDTKGYLGYESVQDYSTAGLKGDFNVVDGDSLERCASATIKIVAEPRIDENGEELEISKLRRYAEIRYVTEIDIDERKLVLDMVGQGVFALAGSEKEYIDAGFDIEELLADSNGNLIGTDLVPKYETGDYDFGSGFGSDFSDFPSLFGTTPEEVCLEYPPEDVVERVQQILDENPSDMYACTSYICLKNESLNTTPLKSAPGNRASNKGYLNDKTIVKVLKEWVNGNGEYNEVLIVDPLSGLSGRKGYIPPKYLKSVSPRQGSDSLIFFDQYFRVPKKLSLQKTQVSEMSPMSRALIPTWWDNEEPYYHTEDGEHWITVELENTCVIDELDLSLMYEEAKILGIKQLFDFYDKSYTEDDVAKMVQSYLAVKSVDHYVPLRPGSKVKVLVKIGGVYLEAFPSNEHHLDQLKDQCSHILSIDLRYFQTHLDQAVFSLNKIYLDVFSSDFFIDGFNFSEEARRLSYIPPAIKKILLLNGYQYNKDANRFSIVNIGFNSNFSEIVFMSIVPDGNQPNSDLSKERILNVGFQFYRDIEPLSIPRTMALLNYHREIKNPTLKWETIFESWLPDPKPVVIPKSIAVQNKQYSDTPGKQCGYSFQMPSWGDILMGIAERLDSNLDLNPRYDLGAFQFNLLQFFPPCPKPPPGKGTAWFKFLSEIDGQTTVANNGEFIDAVVEEASRTVQYVGDFISSGAALKDLKTKIFDLDDLYAYVLNYITPEVLYSKICKCFINVMDDQFGIGEIGIPNLEMGLSGGSGGLNLSPSTIMNNPSEIVQSEPWSFNNNIVDSDGNIKPKDQLLETIKTEDLLCSFCFNIPSLFFRLPTANILDVLIDAIKALLEFALAQILLELIAALLDILLTCPELECSNEAPSVRDYGAQDIAQLAASYAPSKDYSYCGITIGEGPNDATVEQVDKFISEASSIMTTNEIAALLDGSSSRNILKSIKGVSNGYPELKLNSITGIADFFACLGAQMQPEVFDFLESASMEKYEDPLICQNIIDENKEALLEKCGELSPESVQDVLKKNLSNELEKYKEIAKIIRENDDLSSQLPPLFSDGKGGKALLAGMEFDTANRAFSTAMENIFGTIQPIIYSQTTNFFDPKENRMIKESTDAGTINAGTLTLILMMGDLYGPISIEGDKFAGIPLGAGYDIKDQLSVDSILQSLPSQIDTLSAIESNTISIGFPVGNSYISMYLPPPQAGENGEAIYADRYEFSIKKPLYTKVSTDLYDSDEDGILDVADDAYELKYTFNQFYNQTDIAEDLRVHLEQFPLEKTGNPLRPEQCQYFSNLLLSGLGVIDVESSEVDALEGQKKTVEDLKKVLQGDVYYSVVTSVLNGLANKCANSTMITPKENKLTDLISNDAIRVGIEALFNSSTTEIPEYTSKQIEELKLVVEGKPTNQNAMQRTFVDFKYSLELAKRAYDFSIQYDPNSEVLGMPHFAILEGLVSAMIQSFCGEVLMKSVFIAPLFPKELLVNEAMCNFVLINFKDWIETSNDPTDFKWKWVALITRMMAEKPEFTPTNPDAALPGLPGEFGAPAPGTIDGEIYDTALGRTFRIKNWEHATLYYIRQNIERPIKFLKERLASTSKLSGGKAMPAEVNPNDFISYSQMKEVHRATFFQYDDTKPTKTTSIVDDGNPGTLDMFKNGRFFYQVYYRFEDLDPSDEMYNQYLAQRTAIWHNTAVGTAFGPFVPWLPPSTNEEGEFTPKPGAAKWLLEAMGEDVVVSVDSQFGQGAYLGEPENLPEAAIYTKSEDLSLKSVVNNYAVDKLWRLMANPIDNELFNYALTPEQQEKPFRKFFKSIKMGVRFCYGIAYTDETIKLNEGTEEPEAPINPDVPDFGSVEEEEGISVMEVESGQSFVPYNQAFKELKQTLKDTVSTLTSEDPELAKHFQKEKSFVIQEIGAVNVGDGVLKNESYPIHTSFIFPVLSHEIDITDKKDTPFNIPVNKYHDFNKADAKSIIVRLSEYMNQGGGKKLMQENLTKLYENIEFRGLFSYSIPIDKLVAMMIFYSHTAVDADPRVNTSFSLTKNLFKQQIESIYDIRGIAGMSYEPKYLKDRGGPSGAGIPTPEED